MINKIDYKLLSDLAKEREGLERNITINHAYISHCGDYIISSCDNIIRPDFVIKLNEYLSRLKEKERDVKLNNILKEI